MTKLLFCEICGDIVAPFPTANVPRYCRGGCHAVWWVDPFRGILRLYETRGRYDPPKEGSDPNYAVWLRKRSPHAAWVLGLHNQFLHFSQGHSKKTIQTILDGTPDSYIFKTVNSVIIRIRPGESNDTDWAEHLPGPSTRKKEEAPTFNPNPRLV